MFVAPFYLFRFLLVSLFYLFRFTPAPLFVCTAFYLHGFLLKPRFTFAAYL